MSILQQAGTFGYLIAGVGGLGILVILAFAGLGITKRRVPITLWFMLPLLVASLGALGTWIGAGDAVDAVVAAAPEGRLNAALEGIQLALMPDALSRWVGAVLFLVVAWGAGLAANVGVGEERRWTWGAAALSALAAVGSAIALIVWGVSAGVASAGVTAGAILLVGGIGVAVGSMRRGLEEHAGRVATLRFTAGVALVMAASYTGFALNIGAHNQLYAAILAADAAAVDVAILAISTTSTLGWGLLGLALVVGAIGYLAEFGDVIEKPTLIDLFGTMSLVVLNLGVHQIEALRVDGIHDMATLAPVGEIIARSDLTWTRGRDLPTSSLFFGSEVEWVRPMAPFFGDLVVWRKDHWVRTHAWNGRGWDQVEEKLDGIALNKDFPVLLMTGTGEPAKTVVDLLLAHKDDGVHFAILTRVADDLTEMVVPETIPAKVSMIPVKLDERAAEYGGKVWINAASGQVYVGPVRYWGDEADNKKEMAVRVTKALETFVGEGIQVVLSERSRVRDLVDPQLAGLFKKGADGYEPSGRWVNLSQGELEVVMPLAEVGFVPPTFENATFSVTVAKGELDKARVKQLLTWESAAMADCARAFQEGDNRGRLAIHFTIAPNGSANAEMTEGPRNEVKAQGVWDCVIDRVSRQTYPKVEVPEGKTVADAEVELLLTFK